MLRAGLNHSYRPHILGPHAAFADEALNLFVQLGQSAWSREALLHALQGSPLFSLQLLLAVPGSSGKSFDIALGDAVEELGDELLCLWLHMCASRADARQKAYAALGVHARRTAELAFRIASESGLCEPAHARLVGMWHNLGQVGLCWRAGYPGPVCDVREQQLTAGESRQYGSDHAGLLARYLDGLLDVPWMAEAVELHHGPVEFVRGMPGLVRVLRAAVVLLSGEPDGAELAARLVDLPLTRVVDLQAESVASVPVRPDAMPPGLHAPMFSSLLHESFRDLTVEARTLRLRAGCALLGQRELLLCLSESGEQLGLDPAIELMPGIKLPPFDSDSVCLQAGSADRHERPQSAADWLLARQLSVPQFECLSWQHAKQQGVCLFAVPAYRAALADDPVDAKAIRLLMDAAQAAAAQVTEKRDAIVRAVEQGVEHERLKAKRIAHEASNPLTVISNYLAIVERDASLSQSVRDMQRQMRSEIGRIQRLLGKLGQAAPIEAPAMSCMPNEVLREVESFFYETLLVQQDIHLGLQLTERVPEVDVPPDVLKQILVNLVLNAAEAISHHGNIDLRSTLDVNLDDRGWIELCVEDSGPGLSREGLVLTLPRASSKGEERDGVGLTVTRGLIAQVGGRLICRSRAGAGTSFSILLPASERQG